MNIKIYLAYLLTILLVFGNVSSPALAGSLFKYGVEQKDFVSSFTFDELVELSSKNELENGLRKKLDLILYNPIVQNKTDNADTINLNNDKVLGDFVRVASWNIGRGLNFDNILLMFENSDKFLAIAEETGGRDKRPDKAELTEIAKQIEILKSTDIFLLNEVDIGMPRTKYRNIAEEFAKMLGYNYAFGVEFVEVDPAHLGLEEHKWSEENILFPDKEYVVDKTKYKGLHGNAIISRYPIKNARIIRLPDYYGWFEKEKNKIAKFEVARREAADIVFKENVIREIRRGSRIALVADIEIPGMDKPLTVVSVHLENRVVPKYRHKQIKYLLNEIKEVKNPLVMAGDLNTSTRDGSPTSIYREVKKKITDPDFLARQAINATVPYSYIFAPASSGVNFIRKRNDPLVMNIPVVLPNKEKKLFDEIEDMEFADGGEFDFSGKKYRSINNRGNTLSSSNERGLMGFVPTYQFNRDLYIGQFKLDWIFVKPCEDCEDDENDDNRIKPFTPYFGRTLFELNYALNPPISDHVPITVDLPLNPPNKKQIKKIIKTEKKEKSAL